MKRFTFVFMFVFLAGCLSISNLVFAGADSNVFEQAKQNAAVVNEGFQRCQRYVDAWLKLADPTTGLIPSGTSKLIWDPHNAGADNYPFMVLTTSFTNQEQFYGVMRDMLAAEIKYSSRVGNLTDTYDFKTQKFLSPEPKMPDIMFSSAEYVKDGLLPITEWLGYSPWSARMIGILDDMWKYADIETPYGKIVSEDIEVNGEQLQTLSRIYWMSGRNEKYLDWAIRIGDYYLLGNHHPSRDLKSLRLRDHGCEVISGLCELYATCNYARPEKKKQYEKPLHQMLDRILEVGCNQDGLFYNVVNPQTGEILDGSIADNWGYTYNGYYMIYQIDGIERYKQAVIKVLSNLHKYKNFKWEEGTPHDGYADTLEGAINLYNRQPVNSVAEWIDSEIKVMWNMQKPSGLIAGFFMHCDGNFARTTIMYCLWKTQGLTIDPWRSDVQFGAVSDGNELSIYLEGQKEWSGRLIFDAQRHKTIMNLPYDWPRINQFPEWFTVEPTAIYTFANLSTGKKVSCSGNELRRGFPINLDAGKGQKITVRKN
jgi:hypothetical protein